MNTRFRKNLHLDCLDVEHNAQIANIIKKARTKQHSLVITLLDLENASGEVHHNLIQTVLGYHHIPDHIKLLIKSLYTDFKTSIITPGFRTPFAPVGRGVLQGYCLSPLLFNLCFNTFIRHIESEKYRQFGFFFQFLNPLHWFQFPMMLLLSVDRNQKINTSLTALQFAVSMVKHDYKN